MFFGLLLHLISPFAYADAIKGEQDRLRSEMQVHRQKDDWKHMNESFEDLFRTRSKKHPITFTDYVLGAYAAQELGLIHESVVRLQEALKIQPGSQEKDWLNLLLETSEYVSIKVSNKNRALVIDNVPDDIWLQKAINYAESKLNEDGRFQGRLPLGHYTYGDHEFIVATGKKTKLSKIVLKKQTEKVTPPKASISTSPPPKTAPKASPVETEIAFAKLHARVAILGFSYDSLEQNSDSDTVVGLSVGGSYRYQFIPDFILEGSGQIFMATAMMMGVTGSAQFKKRFNKLEVGLGYWGAMSLSPRVLPFNNSGFKPQEIYDHLQGTSGFGLSALYNIQSNLSIELSYALSLNDGCLPWISDKICYQFNWFQVGGVMAFP